MDRNRSRNVSKRHARIRINKMMILLVLLIMVVGMSSCSNQASDNKQISNISTNSVEQSHNRIEPEEYDGEIIQPKIGEIIQLGMYEQDGYPENGPEKIDWIVLDVKGDKVFLVSKYCLDAKPFHTIREEKNTWKDCSLRNWLNNDFLQSAFTEEEQSVIILSDVDNSLSQCPPNSEVDGGEKTTDKIFILSYMEVESFFPSKEDKKASPTQYAVNNGGWVNDYIKKDGQKTGGWWTRSPRFLTNFYTIVDDSGSYDDISALNTSGNVRPALWVNYRSKRIQQALHSESLNKNPMIVDNSQMCQLFIESGSKPAKPGDTIPSSVVFGTYEQDNDATNGKEPIEWMVLNVQEDKMLVICKYPIEVMPYHVEREVISWDRCTLRTWLNEEFINNAFNEQEKKRIFTSCLNNDDSQDLENKVGTGMKETEDRVFLLSYYEVEKVYFEKMEDRMCLPTKYAKAKGAKIIDSKTNCMWWLRTRFITADFAMMISWGGKPSATAVKDEVVCVRPAMWISVE